MLRPKTSMAVPVIQNGRGSQLVALGSTLGERAHCSAMTTRAKSSSLTARKPIARTASETTSLSAAETPEKTRSIPRARSPPLPGRETRTPRARLSQRSSLGD